MPRRPRDSTLAASALVRIPGAAVAGPGWAIARRVGYAAVAVVAIAVIVYIDRDGYTDSADGTVSLLDCFYYATVSASTTGYGDIAPITAHSRQVNTLVVTPLRVFFLIVLVGTTLAALTNDSRQAMRRQRRQRRIHDHTVVTGYGTQGHAAIEALLRNGVPASKIVVVDPDPDAVERAISRGLVAAQGSAAAAEMLRIVEVARARTVVICPGRDETAALITLTARHLAPRAQIVATVHGSEAAHRLRQCGADTVAVSSETAGRILAAAVAGPHAAQIVENLLDPAAGWTIQQRPASTHEVGGAPEDVDAPVLGVVRDGHVLRPDSTPALRIRAGDRLIIVVQKKHRP